MNLGKISLDKIETIKSLRSRGYSVPEISKTIGVSKTSVLRYIKGVEILPEFLENWAGKRGGSRKRKLSKERKAFEEARKIIGNLSNKEKLLFISALYWAEGNKKDFILINSDPDLVKVFVFALREVIGINEDRLHISLRVYQDIDIEKCKIFWSETLEIPKEKIRSINVLLGRKNGKLTYGMCRVRVTKGGDLLKQIGGIKKVVVESFVPIAQMDRAPRS